MFNKFGYNYPVEGVTIQSYRTGGHSIQSYTENIRGAQGRSVLVKFFSLGNEAFEFTKQIGISSKMNLFLNLHTDWESREAFEEYAGNESYPDEGWTEYFFQKDGSFGKIVAVSKKVKLPEDRPTLIDTKGEHLNNIYQSEMTVHDFEIAGAALQMLTNRLQPPQEEAKEEDQEP